MMRKKLTLQTQIAARQVSGLALAFFLALLAVGTILAEGRINIAGISLGREALNGEAVSVVNVDSVVPEETMLRLKKTKDVLYIKLLKV